MVYCKEGVNIGWEHGLSGTLGIPEATCTWTGRPVRRSWRSGDVAIPSSCAWSRRFRPRTTTRCSWSSVGSRFEASMGGRGPNGDVNQLLCTPNAEGRYPGLPTERGWGGWAEKSSELGGLYYNSHVLWPVRHAPHVYMLSRERMRCREVRRASLAGARAPARGLRHHLSRCEA